MDLSLYQKTIGMNSNNISQGYMNDTIAHVNDMFSKSPSYRSVTVDGIHTDCIISRKKSSQLDMLFRPNSIVQMGSYVLLSGKTYLIMDVIENDIYPKAFLNLCNRDLKWKNNLNEVVEYKCFVNGSTYEEDLTKTLYTSDGELTVYVKFNEDTKQIKPQMRFMFDDSIYEVKSIDSVSNVYENSGVLKLGMKFANTSESDDKENQIADSSGNSGWGEWS